MTGIGDIIGPLRVGSPAHGGACVARQEGMAVFIYGTLPGELVRAEVVETRSRLWFARAVEILEPSPYRVPHIWPLAARTGVGGADLGHVSLPMQLKWKADVITEQLRRIAHIEHKVKVEAAPLDTGRGGLGYRTRVDFVADDAGHLGMFIPWSNQIVPIDSMPLVDSKIAAVEPWRHVFEPGSRISLI
ncbi:MAG: TRAM domain-containing protein, partial [Propionibacteriaceae bacterium]|nr:TRAM domain-containing protein [Propionibacteriaceae bacterium]